MTIFLLLSSLHPGNYLHGQKQPDTLSFYLPNILVTAIESKTPGTVSLLPASTLEHTQPITIADLTLAEDPGPPALRCRTHDPGGV